MYCLGILYVDVSATMFVFWRQGEHMFSFLHTIIDTKYRIPLVFCGTLCSTLYVELLSGSDTTEKIYMKNLPYFIRDNFVWFVVVSARK